MGAVAELHGVACAVHGDVEAPRATSAGSAGGAGRGNQRGASAERQAASCAVPSTRRISWARALAALITGPSNGIRSLL